MLSEPIDPVVRDAEPERHPPRFLLGAILVSGFVGLTYEVLWTRYLGLFVGHSAYAQILVLSVYMGGFALGSAAVARIPHARYDAWRAYAGVEAVLAVFGIAFPFVFDVVTAFGYDVVFPGVGHGSMAAGLRWGIAALLILPQAILLGATWPLMAAGVLRLRPDRPARAIGLVYFLNALGGAIGVLVAGFLLVGSLGLAGTSVLAGVMNAMIALAVLALTARYRREAADRTKAGPAVAQRPMLEDRLEWVHDASRMGRGMLVIAGLTAVATFAYEIGWIRMLSLVLGSATHAFELMLSALILGLAIGAWIVPRSADRSDDPVRLLGTIQILMGIAAVLSLPLYLQTFELMSALMERFSGSPEGYALFSVARYGLCLVVMLPASILAGTTVPLITAALLRAGGGERVIGTVYGVNTIGSVLGAGFSGLVALPLLGLKGLVVAGAALDAGLGLWLLGAFPGTRRQSRKLLGAGLAAALPIFAWVMLGTTLSPMLLTSGVYRRGEIAAPEEHTSLYYRDGRTATVSAHIGRTDAVIVLATNGKPDASLGPRWRVEGRDTIDFGPIPAGRDATTQILGPMVGLAHNPDARTIANIGHGSGMSSTALLTSSTVERLVTIEIEPLMVEGSIVFMPANGPAFNDPRSSFVFDDAKSFFAYGRERFDLIFTEPSNPWVSGTSSLFSVEFYERLVPVLTDDGVLLQWLQLYELNDDLFLSVLAALDQVFPAYRAYLVGDSDVVIVARASGELAPPDWSVVDTPEFAYLIRGTPSFSHSSLEALQLFDQTLMRPLLRTVTPNSDLRPVLDAGAERARFEQSYARGIHDLGSTSVSLRRALDEVTVPGVAYQPLAVRGLAPAVRRGRGDWLREALAEGGGISPESFPEWQNDLVDLADFLQRTVPGEVPDSWEAWAFAYGRSDALLHWGTSGWRDASFDARIDAFLESVEEPDEVSRAVTLSRAFSTFDWATAAEAATGLISPISVGEIWVEPDRFLDMTVVSLMKAGRLAEARFAIRTLRPPIPGGEERLAVRLLSALLDEAEGVPGGSGP